MSSHYTPRAFFRQVPNALLKLYFERRKELTGFPWADLDEEEVDPLYEQWRDRPRSRGATRDPPSPTPGVPGKGRGGLSP